MYIRRKRKRKAFKSDKALLGAKVERISKEIRTIKIELEEEIKYNEEFEKKINTSNDEMEKIVLIVEKLKQEEEGDIVKAQEINGVITQKRAEFSDKKIVYLNVQDRVNQIEREREREKKDFEILNFEREELTQKISFFVKNYSENTKTLPNI